MTITYNSDGSLSASGVFTVSDYNAIASFYNNQVGASIGTLSSGHVLSHDDLNAIRNAVYAKQGDYNIPYNFPGEFYYGQIWPATYWGTASYKYREWTYTGNGSFYVPAGVHGINVVMIVAGGGGGGGGMNYEYGGAGGAGGAGGWRQNYHISVNPGDYVQIYIGGAGVGSSNVFTPNEIWSSSGGDSFITVNGNEVLRVTGGGAGQDANSSGNGGAGGYGGSPNGSAGAQGEQGGTHHSQHNTFAGPSGASSPWGQGGVGGISTGQNSNPAINAGSASGYGAGGGGAGTCGTSGYYIAWSGGGGSPGKCVIGLPG